jgi:phosphatidylserine/phosphatidylglycerophosphate/cardiolipin synthase-like enzyme
MKRTLALAYSISWALAGCTADNVQPPTDDTGPADMATNPEVDLSGYTLPSCNDTDPRASAVEMSVLPDDGEAVYVNVLSRAQKSIRMMIYEMGFGGVYDTVIAKAKAGVQVQVIFDQAQKSVNQKYSDAFAAAGAQVLWSDPSFTYMHAKTFVVDDKEAVISTGNFSKKYSVDIERNFVAHITDAADVATMVSLFEADWNRRSPDLSCTRLIVSPVNSNQRVLDFIYSAKTSLDIEQMQFADTDVRLAVAQRKQAGVTVRAILAAPSWITANTDAANFLKGQNIPVKWMTNPNVHVKALVVDGTWVYVGSENLSWTSLNNNREVGLLTSDAAAVKVVTDTFSHDWGAATDF